MKQTNFKSQIFGSILVESIIFFPWRLKMMNPLRPDVHTLIKHTALCRSSSLRGVAFLGDILIFALAVPTEWASSHQTLSAGAQASSIRQLTRLAAILTFSDANVQNIQRVCPLHPSIPWGRFLHSDSFQLSDQFLAASPYWLSEFGEGAAALQSVLCGPAVLHHAGPAGTPVTWTTDVKQAFDLCCTSTVYIEILSFFLSFFFLDTVGH